MDACLTKYFGRHYPKEIVSLIILALPKKIRISCGAHYTTLIKNGKTYVWGQNDRGQLGLGNDIDQTRPQELPLCKDIKSITCGYDFTIALASVPNKLYVWGRNSNGELGLGYCDPQIFSPKELILCTESKIKSISCGESHTIISTESGVCYAWGLNHRGQLGLGDVNNRKSPEKITYLNPNIKKVKCGSHQNVALTKLGNLYSWGALKSHTYFSPREIHLENPIKFKSISCGANANHIIAVTTHDQIYTWGSNSFGQLGLGDFKYRYEPCLVVGI